MAYEMDKPSISRGNHDKNYTLDNCKFEEKLDNIGERNERVLSKKVLQFDLAGNFVREWKSANEIERVLVFANSNIISCCLGKYKSSRCFIWKHKQ